MSTTVKHFHSAMPGAPTLNGVAGSLIAVLDACLVDGFGLKTADSVVVSGGIATATFSTGHSFEPDVIALVTGATPAGLNGEKRVLTTSTNVITFDADGTADGTATGTITVKLAPAGWAKAFAGTNLAAYRSNDVTGTRMFLRVNDTGTTVARVVGYESMSDVDTGVQPFPTSAQELGGGYWPKANAADSGGRAWTLVSSGKWVWLRVHTTTINPGASGTFVGFGDFPSYKSGDAFACAIWCFGSGVEVSGSVQVRAPEVGTLAVYEGPYIARSFTGFGAPVLAMHSAESHCSATGAQASGSVFSEFAPVYPNGPDNGLILTRKILYERNTALRGVAPGFYIAPQICHAAFVGGEKIDGQGTFSGRKLLAIKCGSAAGPNSQGVVFIDITGPWE